MRPKVIKAPHTYQSTAHLPVPHPPIPEPHPPYLDHPTTQLACVGSDLVEGRLVRVGGVMATALVDDELAPKVREEPIVLLLLEGENERRR